MPDSAAPASALWAPAGAGVGGPRWQVRLLGAVQAHGPAGVLVRWPSRAVAALLARIALAPESSHSREELIELLWPGVGLQVGRNRLRQALSTLKSLLEPAGAPAVLAADRLAVRALPGALLCDAVEFESLLRQGHGDLARQAYRGELMPGFYDEWIVEKRRRLEALRARIDDLPPPAMGAAPQAAAASTEAKTTALPGQLPNYWTRLFGVDHSAARLLGLVRSQRLVTVFGAGGSGKTRLAVQAAQALQSPLAWAPPGEVVGAPFDRVAFVSLVDCFEAGPAIDAIAGALGVGGRDPMQQLANALAGRRTLLLLDNFEQLAGQADGMLQRLLTDTATLHLLVTSRQRLSLDGEHVFELTGLGLPDAPAAGAAPAVVTAHAVAHDPAVALFVDRARAVQPDFTMNGPNAAAVTGLVQLLAGMPLAIELAASRMRTLSPGELLKLLTDGQTPMLDLLNRAGGRHSQAQRHSSLRHVVDWSWRQLSPAQVRMMGAMATFAEPALVQTVAAVSGVVPTLAREQLEQLRDSSLLVARQDPMGHTRYVLLQPVREFVAERQDADAARQARHRLRCWLTEFGQRCGLRRHEAIDEVAAELPQVYAAIQGAVADGAYAEAAHIAVALRRHWEVDTRAGLPLSIMQALDKAEAQLDDPALRSELCVLLGFSCVLAGFVVEALSRCETALALAPDARLRTHALLRWAQATMFSDRDQSVLDTVLDEALGLARQTGELEAQGIVLRMQFMVAVNRDDDAVRGEQLALQVQTLWEGLGHRRLAYGGLMDRASCWIAQGRHDEAATALAACEQAARETGYSTGYIMASWQRGRVAVRLRDSEAALSAFRRCVQDAWLHNCMTYVSDALVLTPGGLMLTGQPEAAARLQGFAVAHWLRYFGAFYRDLERDVCFTRRMLRLRLGAVRAEALRLEGAGLTLAQAVALALGPAAVP